MFITTINFSLFIEKFAINIFQTNMQKKYPFLNYHLLMTDYKYLLSYSIFNTFYVISILFLGNMMLFELNIFHKNENKTLFH